MSELLCVIMQWLCREQGADLMQPLLEVPSLCVCNCSIPLWFSLKTFVLQVFQYFVFWSRQSPSYIHYFQTIEGIWMNIILRLRLFKMIFSLLEIYKLLESSRSVWVLQIYEFLSPYMHVPLPRNKNFQWATIPFLTSLCELLERSLSYWAAV